MGAAGSHAHLIPAAYGHAAWSTVQQGLASLQPPQAVPPDCWQGCPQRGSAEGSGWAALPADSPRPRGQPGCQREQLDTRAAPQLWEPCRSRCCRGRGCTSPRLGRPACLCVQGAVGRAAAGARLPAGLARLLPGERGAALPMEQALPSRSGRGRLATSRMFGLPT